MSEFRLAKNILVVGGAGFIGFNFMKHLFAVRPGVRLFCLDKLTYAGEYSWGEKSAWMKSHGVEFIQMDISDPVAPGRISELLSTYGKEIDTVVNFAAESHVDRSIAKPAQFISSDYVGVYSLLEGIRLSGRTVRFHQVSTDEVYGPCWPENGPAGEDSLLCPTNVYAASKASADLLCGSYGKTYGLDITVTRGSNTFGPWQHPEKFIPAAICHALSGEDIPLYGDGLHRRSWLSVNDHCRAILAVLEHGAPGGIYNVAPHPQNTMSNLHLAGMILDICGRPSDGFEFVPDRRAHDGCYCISGDKICSECGFEPAPCTEFFGELKKTVDWYAERI